MLKERLTLSPRCPILARGTTRCALSALAALCVAVVLGGCPGNSASVPDVTCSESKVEDLLAAISSRVVPPFRADVLRDTAASIRRQPTHSLGFYVLTTNKVRVQGGVAAGFKLDALALPGHVLSRGCSVLYSWRPQMR
jgi:hypothetical protein